MRVGVTNATPSLCGGGKIRTQRSPGDVSASSLPPPQSAWLYSVTAPNAACAKSSVGTKTSCRPVAIWCWRPAGRSTAYLSRYWKNVSPQFADNWPRPPMPDAAFNLLRGLWRLPARLLISAVRVYQKLVSPVLPVVLGPNCGCRFYPTCSHYAVEALRSHGALGGGWLTLKRLLRCTPLHPGGLDPVPLRPVCVRVKPTPTQTLSHG